MLVPLVVLMLGAVMAGWAGIPPGNGMIEHWLEPVFGAHQVEAHGPLSHTALAGIALLAAVAGAVLAMSMYEVPLFGVRLPKVARPERVGRMLGPLYRLSYDKFRVDELYDATLVRPFKRAAGWLWRVMDQSVIDGMVNGVGRGFASSGAVIRRLQTGYVRNYAVSMLLGVVVVLIWFVFYK
jgi:NADH-quinone oxidoreductase subunit L